MGSLGHELMPDSDGVPPSNRQRPDVLSLSFWLLAVSHRSCAILFSFLVPRFQFLVFSYLSSGFAFLVPRSQFDTTALLSQSIYTFFPSFSLSSVGSSLSLRSSLSRRLDVHLLLISGWVLVGSELMLDSDGVPPL